MMTEAIRQQLYRDLEKLYPLHRLQKETRARRQPAEPLSQTDLLVQRQRKFMGLKEQLQAQILLHLHTLFEFSADPARLQSAVEQALQELFVTEQACMKNGSYDATGCMLFLFRKFWFANLPSPYPRQSGPETADGSWDPFTEHQPLPLPALHHAQQAGFFTKVPQEVTRWTQRFLMFERYHRLDALEHETRLDRYRNLHASRNETVRQAGWHLDDVMIWLEFRQLEEPHTSEHDLGALSRKLSEELEDRLAPDVLAEEPLQPFLYVLLRCHQFCLAETIEPAEQERLQQLFANRQLDSILDLMRVVVYRTLEDQRLSDTGTILDRLQAEGFNIAHQDFRDPYLVRLVPLSQTEQLERCRLPVFLPIESLSGDFPQDMLLSQQAFQDWHERIAGELVEDYEAFVLSRIQPLPKAHLLPRLLCFAVTQALAEWPWLPAKMPVELTARVRSLLPESAVRQLVRPRKGYEVKSRKDLERLVEAEIQHQWEPLQRIAATRRIQGYHDYNQFSRYLILQQVQETYGQELDMEALPLAALTEEWIRPGWVRQRAEKWGIETQQSHPHTLESVRQYLTRTVPLEAISPELENRFESSEHERRQIYADLVEQIAPRFYQLLVAHERHRLELPRLPADIEEIPRLVRLLAPPLADIQQQILSRLQKAFERSAAPLFRAQTAPYLLDCDEWEAYLAWEIWNHTRKDIAHYREEGDLDRLLTLLQQAADRAEPAPGARAFATVQSTLLDLLAQPQGDSGITSQAVQEIVALLPQLNCMACGQTSCQDFARSLLLGQAAPQHCIHLAAHAIPVLSKTLDRLKPGDHNRETGGSIFDLLRDRHSWRTSGAREAFCNVLSITTQQTRRRFLERLRSIWEQISPKPQIFKCPDLETLYHELCRYMGHEAVERLSEEEKNFLMEHGDHRQQAEWRLLKERQHWLFGAHKDRQSRPLLQSRDPALAAASAYQNIFFLEQLSAPDRERVMQYRLEEHQDGFSHWWNEDLLTMNLPDFSIRDWEDFAKIIKNAYWHQESSYPAADVLAVLGKETFLQNSVPRMVEVLCSRFIDLEAAHLANTHQQLQAFREQPEHHRIERVEELKQLIAALLDETALETEPAGAGESFPQQPDMAAREDRLTIDCNALWEDFQRENFPMSASVLQQLGTSLQERTTFIRNLMELQLQNRYQELVEVQWLRKSLEIDSGPQTGKPQTLQAPAGNDALNPPGAAAEAGSPAHLSFVPVESVRLLIRHRLRKGKSRPEVANELQEFFQSHDELKQGFLNSVLYKLILRRQMDLLQPLADDSVAPGKTADRDRSGVSEQVLCAGSESAAEAEAVFGEAFPELCSFLDLLLKGHGFMDRERLFHYLFLLAKMEGNLDALTALLREIRETSDIMEAAWLRFTQDRILEGPLPKTLPGTTAGIPLLASRIKDKAPVNHALQQGLSRTAKRNVAAAVNELLSFIQFHVLEQWQQGGDAEAVLRDLQRSGCDLNGIETEALRTAIRKQWDRRRQLLEHKIWITTSVTARRLAAEHPELHEAERAFHRIRMELLQGSPSADGDHQEIVSRRGVALGQIKEEVYRQLSDLLEKERMETFQKRIRQIVAQLDHKLREIQQGWLNGTINRRTLFYVLRQYQKGDAEPGWEDFERFLREHWFLPMAELRSSQRPDAEERIRHRDAKFRALLGVSLLELETESRARAEQDRQSWADAQMAALEHGF